MNPTPNDPTAAEGDPFEERLAALERAGQVPLSAAPELAALEAEAWVRLASRDQGLAAPMGHPVAGSVLEWREAALQAGCEEQAQELDELAERLLADLASPALAGVMQGSSESLFAGLLAAARSDREALLARRRDLGPAPHAEQEASLRVALLAALERSPVSEAVRDAWCAELVDLADETLAASLGKAPQHAEAALLDVRAAIKFHRKHVETRRGPRGRRLSRKLARLRDEAVERRLEGRLTQRFGTRMPRIWSRLVLAAIVVLLLLMLQGFLPAAWLAARPLGLPVSVLTLLGMIDLSCCLFILWDFFVRLVFVRGNWTWLRRHIFTDFLPSIPAGIPGLGEKMRALYVFRLGRMMRPLRALMFLPRGIDRLVRLNAQRLDQELVLFPNPMERGLDETLQVRRDAEQAAWGDLIRVSRAWGRSLRSAQGGQAEALVERRIQVLEEAARLRFEVGDTPGGRRGRGYVLEPRLERLAALGPEELGAEFGRETSERIARTARQLAGSPASYMPLIHRWTPRPAPDESDNSLAARWLRALARRGLRWHGRALAMADMATTVSPAEAVGRVGATLVARASRPAYRLVLLGLVFLVIKSVLSLLGMDDWSADESAGGLPGMVAKVYQGAKVPLTSAGGLIVILGSICFVFLTLGHWLQRLARDASLLYQQIAGAQFGHLLDAVRVRRLERDAVLLEQRVLRPERLLHEASAQDAGEQKPEEFMQAVSAWLTEGRHPRCEAEGFDPVPLAVLLYRDQLDAAPFTDADARGGSRLLGSLAVRRLCQRAGAVRRTDIRRIKRGDLSQRQGLLGGGYVWFQLISQAMSQGAARLVVEYNRCAMPIRDLACASDEERERHERWLAARAERLDSHTEHAGGKQLELTNAFTMLHVLDDDPARDAEIKLRFGAELAQQFVQDRRDLYRRVFGTWPLHRLPKEQRVLNPLEFYERWFAHGRIFLTPVWMIWAWMRIGWKGLQFLGTAVKDIRNPGRGRAAAAPELDAAATERKVRRLRGPMVEAAMLLRARLDFTYLGVGWPWRERAVRDGAQDDLAALSALGMPLEVAEQLDMERHAARDDSARLERLLQAGLLDQIWLRVGVAPKEAERLRAVAVAYRADLDGLRSRLSHDEVLAELVVDAPRLPTQRGLVLPKPLLWLGFRRYCREVAQLSGSERRHLWLLVRRDLGGSLCALKAREAARKDPSGEQAAVQAILEDLLRHPGQITEPLVTLRIVQTLTRIDATTLREHVWRLVGFEDEADEA